MLKFIFYFAIISIYAVLFAFSILLQYLVDKEKKENGKSKLFYILSISDSLPNFVIGFMVLDLAVRFGYDRYGGVELLTAIFFAWLPYEMYKYYFRKKFFGDDNSDSFYNLGL